MSIFRFINSRTNENMKDSDMSYEIFELKGGDKTR